MLYDDLTEALGRILTAPLELTVCAAVGLLLTVLVDPSRSTPRRTIGRERRVPMHFQRPPQVVPPGPAVVSVSAAPERQAPESGYERLDSLGIGEPAEPEVRHPAASPRTSRSVEAPTAGEVLGELASALQLARSSRYPRLVRLSPDGMEVMLNQSDQHAPPGWTSSDDGTVWSTSTGGAPAQGVPGMPDMGALLVPLGAREPDGSQTYLNLEDEGMVTFTGDRGVATSQVYSIIDHLVTVPWPIDHEPRVLIVGWSLYSGVRSPRVRGAANWDSVADMTRQLAAGSHASLGGFGGKAAFAARANSDKLPRALTVVVTDQPLPADLAAVLEQSRPWSVVVVAVGEMAGGTNLRCESDAIHWDHLGLAFAPVAIAHGPTHDEAARPSNDAPGSLPPPPEIPGTRSGEPPSVPSPVATKIDTGAIPSEVLVRFLGDITIEGGRPLKAKASAVAAYLALHRSVTSDRLQEACWFGAEGPSHRKRLRDVMTEVRDALGRDNFPANRNGEYIAGDGVGTDLDLFERHLVQADSQTDPDHKIRHLQAALELVSGLPFSYPSTAQASFGWVDLEHHATEWEVRVVKATEGCAELLVRAGRTTEALNVLHRILRALPLSSGLVEALMQAHIANDDRLSVERVYREHAAALAQAGLGEPEESVQQLRSDPAREAASPPRSSTH